MIHQRQKREVESRGHWCREVGVINKENAESALRVTMIRKRNIVRLGARIVIINISNKSAINLHWTLIHTAKCVCERCQIMDTYQVFTFRKLHQFQIKKIKCIPEYDGFWGKSSNDVLEISMYDFAERDGSLDDNLNEL